MSSILQMPPETAQLDSSNRVYKAIKDFELIVMRPAVDADAIYWGYANNMSLPSGSNEYVINTVLNHIEHGTPVTHYELDEAGEFVVRVSKLEELVLQVDAYSDDPEAARMRAECLAAVMRTPLATDFMNKYGLSSFYAEAPRNTTVVVDAETYVHRWTTFVHLAYTHRMTLNAQGFSAVGVEVANVDVRFPPKQH